MSNILIVGATKGMGRSVARQLVARGDRVFIAGRSETELDKSVTDLVARSMTRLSEGATEVAGRCVFDLNECLSGESSVEGVFNSATSFFGGCPDAIIVTAGSFDTQAAYEADSSACIAMLQLNFTATIAFCESARKRLLKDKNGANRTLCVFSSVAGDRGRKPVALYGASKAGLSHYLESIDYRYRADGLNVVCVKPGFVKTSMTAGLTPPPFAGEPDQVADIVIKAIDKGKSVVYAPRPWWAVMAIIKRLPRFIMRRLSF